MENLDGPKTCGVGFAMGMERLMKALEYEDVHMHIHSDLDCYIIPLEDSAKDYAFNLCLNLRLNGFTVDIDYNNRNLKNNFKQADKLNSQFVIIVGNEEKETDIVSVKDNHTKESFKVKKDELISFFDENLEECCNCD